MIVSINQSAYLPWLGYFHRIAGSDIHIVLDHVQFEKNSFTNRNKIRTKDGWMWLSIPVKTKGKFGDLNINDLEIDNTSRWTKKHWESIRSNYAKAKHYNEYAPYFENIYTTNWHRLNDLICEINNYLFNIFGIKTSLLFNSKMNVEGKKDKLILNLCKSVGATVYLSGSQGRNYLDESLFEKEGIKIIYQDYHHPEYSQVYPGFEPYMAAIDLLFNYGARSLEIMVTGQEPIT
jgi:hypothetical protein